MRHLFMSTLLVVALLISPSFTVVPASASIRPQQLLPAVPPADLAALDWEWVISMSDTQRNKTDLFALVQELQALPVGKKYSYYRRVLEQQNYIVLDDYADNQHWEFDLEKKQQRLRLIIAYNISTGISTAITASGPRIAEAKSAGYAVE